MIKKKNETGRSMVEMLGVLAIIGVLSIGGIAGYTMSMRRHRANQVVDALNKYAVVIYGACQKAFIDGDIPSLAECSSQHAYPTFQESGLGTIGEASIHGLVNTIGTNSIYDNVTTARIGVHFRDKEICKSVRSIVGGSHDSCGESSTSTGSSSYYLIVPCNIN